MRTGFYDPLTQGKPSPAEVDQAYLKGFPLVLVTVTLDPANDTISPAVLLPLADTLARCRTLGVGAIFRAAYSWDKTPRDPSLLRIMRHVDQLAALLEEFIDIVLTVQVGMIGSWGECNNSASGHAVNGYALESSIVPIIAGWLFGFGGYISVRCPHYAAWYLAKHGDEEKARLGLHNDSFASSNSNGGTYIATPSVQYWKDFAKTMAIYGGETVVPDPLKETYWNGAAALAEVMAMRVCYLNAEYSTVLYDKWKASGHYNQIALAMAANAPDDWKDRQLAEVSASLKVARNALLEVQDIVQGAVA